MNFKRILFLTLCIILLISFFILIISAACNITMTTSTNISENLPVVVIDPGHGECVINMVA